MSIYASGITQSDPSAWYAVQVRTRCEKAVAQLLSHRGYEYFLPYRMSWNRQTRESAPVPLFPGYLFCCLDMSDRRAPVITTPGVIRLVGVGERPTPVPVDEINSLQTVVNSTLPFEGTHFGPLGSKVLIVRGPLRGAEGYLYSIKSESRLVVQITLLQRAVSVEIDRSSAIPFLGPEDQATLQLSRAN